MIPNSFYSWKNKTLFLEIQVQTKASKNAIVGEYNHRLKVAITAAPTDGKANDYLIKFLAKYFSVPSNQVKIVRGYKNKHKSIQIMDPKNNLNLERLKNT